MTRAGDATTSPNYVQIVDAKRFAALVRAAVKDLPPRDAQIGFGVAAWFLDLQRFEVDDTNAQVLERWCLVEPSERNIKRIRSVMAVLVSAGLLERVRPKQNTGGPGVPWITRFNVDAALAQSEIGGDQIGPPKEMGGTKSDRLGGTKSDQMGGPKTSPLPRPLDISLDGSSSDTDRPAPGDEPTDEIWIADAASRVRAVRARIDPTATLSQAPLPETA